MIQELELQLKNICKTMKHIKLKHHKEDGVVSWKENNLNCNDWKHIGYA